MKNIPRKSKIIYSLLSLVFIELTGTLGFMLIEGMRLLDALYMTVITIATVGFNEIHPLSDGGKIFTIFLIISSMGVFVYAISLITTSIIDGEFREYFKDYRVNSEIRKMENHVIVCGYGRNGKQAVQELIAHKQQYVVIEEKRDVINDAASSGNKYFIEGDATQDEVLLRSGIKSAKALICTFPFDADNLYVVLSARSLNPNLKIISRATNDSSEGKLLIAGANSVVMPDKVGGSHMATLVLKPDVVEFLKHISVYETINANLEEITCEHIHSSLSNKPIKDINIHNLSGANIIGYKSTNGEFFVNPSPDVVLSKGSKFFVLGTAEQIQQMKNIFKNGINN